MTEQSTEPSKTEGGDPSQPGDDANQPEQPQLRGRMLRVLLLTTLGSLALAIAWSGGVVADALAVTLLVGGLGLAIWWVRPGSGASIRFAGDVAQLTATLWVFLTITADGQLSPLMLVATLAVAGVILIDAPLTRLARVWVPFVSNMPGVTPAPTRLGWWRQADVVSLVALAVGVVVVTFGGHWIWPVVGLLMISWPAALAVRTVQRLLAGRRIEAAMAEAVSAYAPEFLVYTSRPDEAAHQISMWLPYLQRTGRRFIIVARTNVAAAAIAEATELPVITRRRVSDLEAILADSLRVVFYVNASSGNGAMVRYGQLTHVYLGHGDSDKPPSFNPTHAMYDVIFAAGQAATERYGAHGVSIAPEKFRIVGRPQVEDITPPRPGPPQTVLYAPTWRGHVAETLLYSLPRGEQIVRALLDRGMRVIFRTHPFSYDFAEDVAVIERIHEILREDAARSGRQHLYGAAAETELGIIECMNESDAMISDVSSVVSDYLFSEKPLGIVAVPCPIPQFVVDYPVARAGYVIEGELTNLETVLDDLLGSDPHAEARRQVRDYYLGDFAGRADYAEVFVEACRELVDAPLRETSGGVDDSIEVDRGRAAMLVDRIRNLFARYARDLVLAGGALLACLLAGTGHRAGALVCASAVVLVSVVVSRRAFAGGEALNRLLGSLMLARVLTAYAVLILWGASENFLGRLCCVILVVLTALELPIRGGWTGAGTGVLRLPGMEDPPAPRLARGVLAVANLAQLIVLLVLAWTTLPAPIALITGLVGVVIAGVVLTATDRRVGSLDQVSAHLRAAVEAHRPQFAVYFSSTIGADYQVGMWAQYFDRIGVPYVYVVRSLAMMRAIGEIANAPVIFRPTLRSLEDVIVPSMTAAFYVNNAVRNTHFIERRELTHIWLNHGDSEKPACFNPVHAIYDRIYAAGQAGIDRYARHGVHIPLEKFQIVGRPQVELITPSRGPIAELPDKTVLYAPTWRGPYADSRVYSLPVGPEIVKALLARGCRVVFRAHPFNERFPEARAAMSEIAGILDADRRKTGRDHVWGDRAQSEWTIEDCFNASDAMIADVSAVLSDYLKANKPFSIVSVGRTPEQLIEDAPVANAAYLLRDDLGNLDAVLDDLLVRDPLAEIRATTKVYYLGDFPDATYADGFLNAARAVAFGSDERQGN